MSTQGGLCALVTASVCIPYVMLILGSSALYISCVLLNGHVGDYAGAVLIIVIVFMAVTSSGASEMVAISSLFTFDVYRRYIDPKVGPLKRFCRQASMALL